MKTRITRLSHFLVSVKGEVFGDFQCLQTCIYIFESVKDSYLLNVLASCDAAVTNLPGEPKPPELRAEKKRLVLPLTGWDSKSLLSGWQHYAKIFQQRWTFLLMSSSNLFLHLEIQVSLEDLKLGRECFFVVVVSSRFKSAKYSAATQHK